jgi:hypothetical protein
MPTAVLLGIGIVAFVIAAVTWNQVLVGRINRKMKDLLDSLIGGEDPPTPPRQWPYARWAIAALTILTLVAVVVSELVLETARAFWERHPMAAALGSGVLIVALTTLIVEEVRDGLKTRSREKPALMALQSYLFAADHATEILTQAIDDHAAQISPETGRSSELGRVEEFRAILDADPTWFQTFSRLVEDQVRSTSAALVQVAGAISQYPPLLYALDELDAVENDLVTLGLYAKSIPPLGREELLRPPEPLTVEVLSELLSRRRERYMTLFLNESTIARRARKRRIPKPRLYWHEKRKALELLKGIVEIVESNEDEPVNPSAVMDRASSRQVLRPAKASRCGRDLQPAPKSSPSSISSSRATICIRASGSSLATTSQTRSRSTTR